MKRLIIIGCTLFIVFSFRFRKPKLENVNNLVVFYIENSKGDGNTSLSSEAIERLEVEVKKNHATPTNKFLLYWSNDAKFDYTKKAESSPRILNGLFEKNSRIPNVWFDKYEMRTLLFEKEFTLKGNIIINFFITESYLIDYISKDEPSILMGLFPRELAYITGADESKLTVNIYYTNTQNKISEKTLREINNFTNQSKATYNYIQLN